MELPSFPDPIPRWFLPLQSKRESRRREHLAATKGGSVGWSRRADNMGTIAPKRETEIDSLQKESIDYFVSFVQMFGLPKSIGQIYGVLFVSTEPLSMDDVIHRLNISKGSASQGLTLLRSLGAVTVHQIPGDRRDHFVADLNVSRIVTHFFENRLSDRLVHADERLKSMLRLARVADREATSGEEKVLHRIQALQKWQKRGKNILPLIVRWLKR